MSKRVVSMHPDHPDAEREPEHESAVATFAGVRAPDLIKQRAPEYVIEDVAIVQGITSIIGDSNTGKGFAALSMCATVATGSDWMGRRVKHGSAAYFAFEGDALQLRLDALDAPDHVWTFKGSEPLSPLVHRDGLETPSPGAQWMIEQLRQLADTIEQEQAPPLRVIVVDTARASMTGSEESSENVTRYLGALREILKHAPDAGLLVLLHTGWQDGENSKRRERGSSYWRGGPEVALYLETEPAKLGQPVPVTLSGFKARDGETGFRIHMERRVVDLLRRNQWGEPVTTCVMARDVRDRAAREADRKAAQAERDTKLDAAAVKVVGENTITSRKDLSALIAQEMGRKGIDSNLITPMLARLNKRGLIGRKGDRGAWFVKGNHDED